jgi:phage tail sheath protein FI
VTFTNIGKPETVSLVGGVSDDVLTDSAAITGYSLFANTELVDVSLIPLGGASQATQIYVINNVAEARKDCMAFMSPALADVLNAVGIEANNIIAVRNALPSSSYAALDSGWKYQYDRYNDVYRWIPLNGDSAGLCARTDFTNDPWWSPAGFNRGQIKNVIKLAYSPNQTDRDRLYPIGVNPVVSFKGQGTILYGDKTMLSKPSSFDRINVRRLFIVLEKAIATASKYQLFEFNDPFTRAQFRSFVEPFLRDVKGRRGIADFLVVCDETNNTGEVIDGNRFKASIYIKAARSINFIELQFVSTPTGAQFSEVVGI